MYFFVPIDRSVLLTAILGGLAVGAVALHFCPELPTTSVAGALLGAIGMALSATEAIGNSVDQRYGALFDEAPRPTWVYDCETLKFLAVNRAALELYGFSLNEFLAMRVTDIRPPSDAELLPEEMVKNNA